MYFLYMSDPGNGKFLERGAPYPQMTLKKRIFQIRKKPCSTELKTREEGMRLETLLPTKGSGTQVARDQPSQGQTTGAPQRKGPDTRCV